MIHDELGPRLFSVAAQLTALEGVLRGEKAERVAAILCQIEETRRLVRAMAHGGAPPAPAGLGEALEAVARQVDGRFDNQAPRPIREPRLVDSLYRIAREAAHNAKAHGGAGRITIRLKPGVLSVEDDGAGPPGQWREGMGMELMRRRTRRVGGRITLRRVASGMTILTCHFGAGAK